ADKNVQRTVQSAEVSASGQIEEASPEWTVRCTSAPFRPIGVKPRQGLNLSPLFSNAFQILICGFGLSDLNGLSSYRLRRTDGSPYTISRQIFFYPCKLTPHLVQLITRHSQHVTLIRIDDELCLHAQPFQRAVCFR